jgi:hypothetical protein
LSDGEASLSLWFFFFLEISFIGTCPTCSVYIPQA